MIDESPSGSTFTGGGLTSLFSFGSRNRRASSNSRTMSISSPSRTAKKILCRYGMGCTHVSDPLHRERFWHPPVPDGGVPCRSDIEKEVNVTIYPCHECGLGFRNLSNLQLHLKRKTAWSNKSLVGCRISCLIDNREWQEGTVMEYSAITGKHRVRLEHMGEIRWMAMLRSAFFIIRRSQPPPASEQSETKEVEMDVKGLELNLAPLEPWTYEEDISLNYSKAQALMHKAYGCMIQETGHKTQGHLCVTENDKVLAKDAKSSLLYGELLPRGINKAMVAQRLNGDEAHVIYELGMGIGKVAMQVFIQFPSVTRVYGVELSAARFLMAEDAAKKLCDENPKDYSITSENPGQSVQVTNLKTQGVLDMEVGNLLDVQGMETADIVLLETDLSSTIYLDLCRLLRKMKRGSRAFTYLDLRKIWTAGAFPYRQLEINRPITDRYATSWSVNRGHHFFLWAKVLDSDSDEVPAVVDGVIVEQPDAVARGADETVDYHGYPIHVNSPGMYPMSDGSSRRGKGGGGGGGGGQAGGRRRSNHSQSPQGKGMGYTVDGSLIRSSFSGWAKSFRRFWKSGMTTSASPSSSSSLSPVRNYDGAEARAAAAAGGEERDASRPDPLTSKAVPPSDTKGNPSS